MSNTLQDVRRLILSAIAGFRRHSVTRLGAAIAFFTLLSLSPLLLIVLSVAGPVFGHDAANGAMTHQIESLLGREGAAAVQSLIADADRPAGSLLAKVIGGIVLLFGATGVFVELRETLDLILEIPEDQKKRGLVADFAIDRLMAFSLICGLVFLLLVSLVISAVITAMSSHLSKLSALDTVFAYGADLIITVLLTALLFAMVFRILPSVRQPWHQVWFGSLITTGLFLIGKSLIGLYLGRTAVGSAYGAAGSLVVLLIWVFYSVQILLFGAELVRAKSQSHQSVRLTLPESI